MPEPEILDIPIVAYPPFKLRSSLIDKDPVIWVHLIEYYILLFQRLIKIYSTKSAKLSIKSQQQLTVFLNIYLHETAEESSKIFSLGSINPDIVKNSKILKLYVFEFIKSTNLINLNLSGDSIWNFVKVYTKLAQLNSKNKNFPVTVSMVRQLIEGSVKSKINSKSNDISLIKTLHTNLKNLIESGKFTKHDLEGLSLLLGKYVHNADSTKVRRIGNNNKSKNAPRETKGTSNFAEKFTNGSWIEILEVLYNKGTTIHFKTVFEVAIISILSLPTIKVSKLISVDLNVNSFKAMIRLFPLLSTIILSDSYTKMNPGLDERLPFLSKEGRKQSSSGSASFDQDSINMIHDLFPQLSDSQVKRLLLDNNHNVDMVTNQLLETDPSEFGNLPGLKEFKRSVYDNDDFDKMKFDKSNVYYGKKDKSKYNFDEKNLKEKTLTAALRLLYESDEDEPDDTYDDQELTSSAKSLVNKADNDDDSTDSSPTKVVSLLEQTEHYLFQIYKNSPEALERASRKSKIRQSIKDQTKWSDEQIEGWARMLLKQPAKFRMLDEQYNFGGVSQVNRTLKQATSYRKPKAVEEDADSDDDVIEERQNFNRLKQPNGKDSSLTTTPKAEKIKKLRDAKNKLSRANHNRKSGHDKKMSKGFV